MNLRILARCLAGFSMVMAVAAQAGRAEEPAADVGWCAFYPGVDVGMDVLPRSGASILSVCAGGWSMAPAPGTYDFSALEKQIDYAERHGLELALINEINPLYAPEWLRRRAREAGQSVRGASGADGSIPSIRSTVFAEAQADLVRETLAFVKRRDRRGVVRYYHPGAEWWFPLGERYHPADVAQFRAWLGRKYGTVAALNAAWQAQFDAFDKVPAPKIDMFSRTRGATGMATVTSLDDGSAHASWSTAAATDPAARPGPQAFAEVVPGRTYTATAWVRSDDVRGPGALIELAWIGPKGGPPLSIDDGEPARGTEGWRRVSVTAKAPKDAARAWILLKLMGTGSATFDDVELRDQAGGPNLAPNPGFEDGAEAPAAWSFQDWAGGTGVTSRVMREGARSGRACVQIGARRADPAVRGYRNDTAAVHDWSSFWYEAGADYINSLARQAKRLDPSRKTVTYLTMSWAYPSEWDESQRSAIAPDEVARRGADIDAFGMQLCAADGDPYRATACLDLMRKYRKPLWAVDLVDFTSGVHIGYPAMDRITQAAIQHGASGIIYCAWHMPTVLDYSFHPNMPIDKVHQMLADAQAAVRLMAGMSVRPDGALVLPILPASPADGDGFRNDYRSAVGWYKLLERQHRTFDVVTLRELETGSAPLDRYAWVVVPDCPATPTAALRRLAAYAASGGRVVTGGWFALQDETGRPVDAISRQFPRRELPDLGRRHAGDPIRDTHAGNTPPLFLWRTDTPDALAALAEARPLLHDLLSPPGDYEVIAPDADVTAVRHEAPGRLALYLVNRGPSDARGVRVRLRASQSSRVQVYADMKRLEGSVRVSDRLAELDLPAFRSSAIVVVETHE